MPDKTLPKGVELTEYDAAFRADPHKRLDTLRGACPVYYDPEFGHLFLTRYEDVRATVNSRAPLRHPRHAHPDAQMPRAFRQERDDGQSDESILFMDEPEHMRVRAPLQKAFYKRVAQGKPLTEAIIKDVLDGLEGRETFDVLADFAIPVPILVIAHILGVPQARLAEFREWSEGIILSLNPLRSPEQTAQMQRAQEALRAFFTAEIAARRTQPRDDLLTDLVRLQDEGAPLSDSEITTNSTALLVGGNLTTTDLIGNAMWLLLTHPKELAKLKADPSLISAAVEEVLRIHGPVMITSRVANAAGEIGGCPMRDREWVVTSLAAANHDPSVFERPHEFDITRKHVPHIAFGGGTHICIGAPLARLEAQVAIPALFNRFPNLSMAPQEIEWKTLPFFHGLERLIVRP